MEEWYTTGHEPLRMLDCPDCEGKLVLQTNDRFGLFYGCQNWPTCRASHGAHPNGDPMGVPGNAETRKARREVHKLFESYFEHIKDEIVKKRARNANYRWLAHKMGLTKDKTHMAMFTKEQCKRAVELLRIRAMKRSYLWKY